MKIAIINDIHLQERNPRIRKDNFLQSTLDKLEYVANNNDVCIIPGDLFHSFANSTFFFNIVYKFFKRHKGKFIVIPGNHDVMLRNYNLEKTTLGSLMLTGVIDVKTNFFYLDNVLFGVSLCEKNISKIPVDEKNEGVLLGHNYYEMDLCLEESLTAEDIKKLNYKYVCLNHDHSPYDDLFVGNSILYRIGSFTRHDKNTYNRDRQIFYLQFDTETGEMVKLKVPCKQDEEIFIDGAFDSKVIKENITFIKVADVLAKLQRRGEGDISLHKTLIELKAPSICIGNIREKHRETSTVFN